MLTRIADFYGDEVDTAVDALTSLIEPIMIVFMGGIVGGMVIACCRFRDSVVTWLVAWRYRCGTRAATGRETA
jgi:hypothetical protein